MTGGMIVCMAKWLDRFRGQRRTGVSISNPILAEMFGYGGPAQAGVVVGERSALGVSALYRAVALVAGTLACQRLRTMQVRDGQKTEVASFLDTMPAAIGMTQYEWIETSYIHAILHGNTFLLHVAGGAGQLVGLLPVHPLAVGVEQASKWEDGRPVVGGKIFRVTMQDGSVLDCDADTLTHVPGFCTDGVRGLGLIDLAKESLGTAIAADRAAARMFGKGALMAGTVSPADGDPLEEDERDAAQKVLDQRATGWENASAVRLFSRPMNFTPWTMTSRDAQYMEARAFQVEEISRWTGVPPHLLMQTDKQTSWGTGVSEQNRAMGRTVLAPWATRLEQRLSMRMPAGRTAEFDFSRLERPAPEVESALLGQKVKDGLMTPNEARAVLGLPPLAGGDTLVGIATPAPVPAITGAPA
jgi:HK97 family phage portal protein